MSPEEERTPDADAATIAAWLDGALDGADRAAVEARLAADAAFAARVEAERRTLARAEALLEQLPLPAGRGRATDLERIRATLRGDPSAAGLAARAPQDAVPRGAVPRGAPGGDARSRAWLGWGLAAALAIVAGGGVLLRDRGGQPMASRPGAASAAADTAMPAASAAAPMVAAVPATDSTSASPSARSAARAPAVAARTPAPAREAVAGAAAPAAEVAPGTAPREAADERAAAQAAQGLAAAAPAVAAPAAPVPAPAADVATRARAARPSAAALDDAAAAALLGARVPTLRGAVRVALDTTAAASIEGARADRALVVAGWREPSGRVVRVAMQRAAAAAEREPPWRDVGAVRARLLGDLPPAAADSLLQRLVP